MPMKVYAEDLAKLEDDLENVERELAEHLAKPKIIRRLLTGKIEALQQRKVALGWKVAEAREHVQADATSAALYERQLADRKREKEAEEERKRREQQQGSEPE